MPERILVAVDDSGTSRLALREAVRLASDHKAQLRIVHVVENAYCCLRMAEGLNVERIARAWRQAGQTVLDQAAAEAQDAGVEPEMALLEQRGISSAIVAEATRWDAVLIVLGTHGRRGLARLLLGSVAEAVARSSPTAVMVVPAQ